MPTSSKNYIFAGMGSYAILNLHDMPLSSLILMKDSFKTSMRLYTLLWDYIHVWDYIYYC